jgi:hypothetical protein
MPIVFDKEVQGWKTQDLTEEEKNALIEVATAMITDQFGAELAQNVLELLARTQGLKAMPKEFMGNA